MTNVIQFAKHDIYDEVEFEVETAEELELIETAEEVRDAIDYFIKQVKLREIAEFARSTNSDEHANAMRELRIIKEFYRMKEFTTYFEDVID